MSSIMTNAVTQSAANAVAQSLLPNKQLSSSANAAAVTGKSNATTAASTSGDITSNDFLTLLVTEMKNQDPTQPTDPNAYIQQLVGVNSLQQLISINQGLTTFETPTKSNSGIAVSGVSGADLNGAATPSSSAAVSSAAVTNGVSSLLDLAN